jgi:hypothetical protein
MRCDVDLATRALTRMSSKTNSQHLQIQTSHVSSIQAVAYTFRLSIRRSHKGCSTNFSHEIVRRRDRRDTFDHSGKAGERSGGRTKEKKEKGTPDNTSDRPRPSQKESAIHHAPLSWVS